MKTTLPLDGTLDEITRDLTIARLHLYRGCRGRTSHSLGIGIRTLSMWINKWVKADPTLQIPESRGYMSQTEIAEKEIKTTEPTEDSSKLKCIDVSTEAWREYRWFDQDQRLCKHRINQPIRVYYHPGGSTHRVVYLNDTKEETAVCLPAPGYFGCTIHWQPIEGKALVTA